MIVLIFFTVCNRSVSSFEESPAETPEEMILQCFSWLPGSDQISVPEQRRKQELKRSSHASESSSAGKLFFTFRLIKLKLIEKQNWTKSRIKFAKISNKKTINHKCWEALLYTAKKKKSLILAKIYVYVLNRCCKQYNINMYY